jgi:hypothetical protein
LEFGCSEPLAEVLRRRLRGIYWAGSEMMEL